MKKLWLTNLLFAVAAILVSCLAANAQIASGGAFTLEQAVVATGGGESAGGAFLVMGTIGQPAAGGTLGSVQFQHYGGFWSPSLTPTAGEATVGGRVLNSSGRGVFGVQIVMTDAFGIMRYARTNPFGYFRFAAVEAGQTYVFSARHKRFQFANNPQVLFVAGDSDELVFNALP